MIKPDQTRWWNEQPEEEAGSSNGKVREMPYEDI